MGIQNIWPLLSASGHTTSLELYSSKKVAIDTSIWLHQYAHVTGGADLTNSLLFGLFCRILKMKYYGIKPVFVFDGKTPVLKKKCLERRRKHWGDEKRMKGALKKLIMREKVKARVEKRIYGERKSEEVEQEQKEKTGELNFHVDASTSFEPDAGRLSSAIHDSFEKLHYKDEEFESIIGGSSSSGAPSSQSQNVSGSPYSSQAELPKSQKVIDLSSDNSDSSTDESLEPSQLAKRIASLSAQRKPEKGIRSSPDDVKLVSIRKRTTSSARESKTLGQGIKESSQSIQVLQDRDFQFGTDIALGETDIDPEVFRRLPEEMQKEILDELETRINYKYGKLSWKLTKKQGGGRENFSSNQIEVLMRSNSANRSLRKIKEMASNSPLGSEKRLPDGSMLWRGTDAHGESIQLIDMSQSTMSDSFTQDDSMGINSSFSRPSNNTSSVSQSSLHGENTQSENPVDYSSDSHSHSHDEEISNSYSDFDPPGNSDESGNVQYEGGFLEDSADNGDAPLYSGSELKSAEVTSSPYQENTEDSRNTQEFTPTQEFEGGFFADEDDSLPESGQSASSLRKDLSVEFEGGFLPEVADEGDEEVNSSKIDDSEDLSEEEWEDIEDSNQESSIPKESSLGNAPKDGDNPNENPNSSEDEWEEIENNEEQSILDEKTVQKLKILGIDSDVFLSLPMNVRIDVISQIPSDLTVSPILAEEQKSEEKDFDSEKKSFEVNTANLSTEEEALSRVLFPTTMFTNDVSQEEYSQNINTFETEFETGVEEVDVHSISILSSATKASENSPSLSRSFELENLELIKAYSIENPGYTPEKAKVIEGGFTTFTPSMYDTTPNTLLNTPEYQRRVNMSNSRREGSLAIYNEHRELINMLFRFMGVPYIQSPYEADAQCGFLSQKKMVDAIISDDSDIFIFGGDVVLKFAFSKGGDRHIEEYTIESIEKHLGLSRRDLIAMAMLLGCDYTEGVHNVGPVTAVEVIEAFRPDIEEAEKLSDEDYILRILSDFTQWANLMSATKPTRILTRRDRFMYKYFHLKKRAVFPSGFPDRMIVRAYLNPQVDTSEDRIEWGDFQFTPEFYDFASTYLGLDKEKVHSYVDPVVARQKERETQTNMMSYVERTRLASINSKRVQHAVSNLKRMKRKRDDAEEMDNDSFDLIFGNGESRTPTASRKVQKKEEGNHVGSFSIPSTKGKEPINREFQKRSVRKETLSRRTSKEVNKSSGGVKQEKDV